MPQRKREMNTLGKVSTGIIASGTLMFVVILVGVIYLLKRG